MTDSKIIIYCDGGLGNRLNALLSGMAIVHYFGIDYVIHWPANQWCAAAYSDILGQDSHVSTASLISLNGTLGDHAMLLHDSIAADALGVPFASAYDYTSLDDLHEKLLLIILETT